MPWEGVGEGQVELKMGLVGTEVGEMEQAQSQASCRVPLLCLLLPQACPAPPSCFLLIHEPGEAGRGAHPTSLHPQEGSAQPCFGEML